MEYYDQKMEKMQIANQMLFNDTKKPSRDENQEVLAKFRKDTPTS